MALAVVWVLLELFSPWSLLCGQFFLQLSGQPAMLLCKALNPQYCRPSLLSQCRTWVLVTTAAWVTGGRVLPAITASDFTFWEETGAVKRIVGRQGPVPDRGAWISQVLFVFNSFFRAPAAVTKDVLLVYLPHNPSRRKKERRGTWVGDSALYLR